MGFLFKWLNKNAVRWMGLGFKCIEVITSSQAYGFALNHIECFHKAVRPMGSSFYTVTL